MPQWAVRPCLGHVALPCTSAFRWCAQQCWGWLFLWCQLDDVRSVCVKQQFLLPPPKGVQSIVPQ